MRKLQAVLQTGPCISPHPSRVPGFHLLHVLSNTCYCFFFLMIAILVAVKQNLTVALICISLMTCNVEHPFILKLLTIKLKRRFSLSAAPATLQRLSGRTIALAGDHGRRQGASLSPRSTPGRSAQPTGWVYTGAAALPIMCCLWCTLNSANLLCRWRPS